jgi:hypothetical protein
LVGYLSDLIENQQTGGASFRGGSPFAEYQKKWEKKIRA